MAYGRLAHFKARFYTELYIVDNNMMYKKSLAIYSYVCEVHFNDDCEELTKELIAYKLYNNGQTPVLPNMT